MSSCSKTSPGANNSGGVPGTTPVTPPAAFDINSIHDTYDDVSAFAYYPKWGSYNVHDPSIIAIVLMSAMGFQFLPGFR
jgi:arabinan endo-1,5-alpha-L-arabinosidase